MKWFLDFTTRGKLLFGFGLMIVFLVAAVVTAYMGITAIQDSQKNLYQKEFANALDLMELRTHQNAVWALQLSMLMLTQRSDQELLHKDIKKRSETITAISHRLSLRNRSDLTFSRRLDELNVLQQSLVRTRDDEIIPMIYAEKTEQARALALGIQEERNGRIRGIADELGDAQVEHARVATVQSEGRAQQAVKLFVIIAVLAILLGIAMAVFLGRIIAQPLKAVSEVAERVAAGDLTVKVVTDHRLDEVGVLVRAFSAMLESQRRITSEIRDGIAVLDASSSEILATTTQVASGAAETASAVSETTATVEEVKQTAGVSSQKAKHVSESAQKVSQVSQSGRKSVDSAILGMQRIQEQMESIAESVVRLSEQGQAIGEIIAAVNDLTEQSNLLAVNAAIEAAKAGEQGKGFGVVAQEIKSLAEQSRQATAQVRGILGDIQKATSAAVLATEQGNKAVEAGVKQSNEAGESIRLLADSVSEAAQAAIQIAASSQQQMVGMDQVAMAMENIKQASIQNVTGARQVETAAQKLHELGRRLKERTEKVKV